MTISILDRFVLSPALALVLCAGFAMAQDQEKPPEGISVAYVAEGRNVEVALIDGQVKVLLDGKLLPPSRLRLEDGRLQVIEGNRLLAVVINLAPDSRRYSLKPKVRKKIGVNVKALDPALASQLRLKPDQALVVLGVAHDLAAAKAGLKIHDVITHVSGRTPVDLKVLQGEISKVEDGQPVNLRILRKGKAQTLDVYPRSQAATTDKEGRFTITTTQSGQRVLHVTPTVTWRKNKTVSLRNDPLVVDLLYPEGDGASGKAATSEITKRMASLEARLKKIESLLLQLLKETK